MRGRTLPRPGDGASDTIRWPVHRRTEIASWFFRIRCSEANHIEGGWRRHLVRPCEHTFVYRALDLRLTVTVLMVTDDELLDEPGGVARVTAVPEMPLGRRVRHLIVAWAAAGIVTIAIAAQGPPGVLPFVALTFPLGLFLLVIGWQPPIVAIVIVGWLACIVPTLVALAQGRHWRFCCIYVALCLVFVVNAVGWFVMVTAGWQE
jgi:hypothetical protein